MPLRAQGLNKLPGSVGAAKKRRKVVKSAFYFEKKLTQTVALHLRVHDIILK